MHQIKGISTYIRVCVCVLCQLLVMFFFSMMSREHSWRKNGMGKVQLLKLKKESTSPEKSSVTRVSVKCYFNPLLYCSRDDSKLSVWRVLIWVSMKQKSGFIVRE